MILPIAAAALAASIASSGLTLPEIASGHQIVSIVATDIDRDGDLDVVAIDGSLELIVWVNDGLGHLTRKEAERSNGLRSGLPDPVLKGQPATSEVSIRNDSRAARIQHPADTTALDIANFRTPDCLARPGREFVTIRTPRAPPASMSLA